MPQDAEESRAIRRCSKACVRCRDMKVRCSGSPPCNRCKKSDVECVFAQEDARVTVSQSYLRSLQDKASSHKLSRRRVLTATYGGSSPSLSASSSRFTNRLSLLSPQSNATATNNIHESLQQVIDSHGSPSQDPSEPDFERNPLVDTGTGESFARDRSGKYWYMGPTSSWAFCRRVFASIGSRMPEPEQPIDPWDLESLNLTWNPVGLSQSPAIDNLPSYDYALFILSTVKYYLGTFSEVIDYGNFATQLKHFYDDPVEHANRERFWYAQFLFVLAFGEAFTSSGDHESVPGIEFASRALSLIPAIVPLEIDTVAAVEALCLAALYLQSVDLRLLSSQLVGQALRICSIEGWHRRVSLDVRHTDHFRRCATIFWIVYVMDREFGTLIGNPSSIRDEDITVELPSELVHSPSLDALTLQVYLARLTATILQGVYGVNRGSDRTLIKDTQSVLQMVAAISEELSAYLNTNLGEAKISTSKSATRLILSYHHCVVLTTRPLVMCALERGLNKDGTSVPEGPVSSLLRSCTLSALYILRISKGLGDTGLQDSFLPFQMEATFSSAFLLCIINLVCAHFLPDNNWLSTAHGIFDIMIRKGSPGAKLRKRELARLEQILETCRQQRPATSPVMTPFDTSALDNFMGTDIYDEAESRLNDVDDIFPLGVLGSSGGFVMSPEAMLGLVQDLAPQEGIPDYQG